MTGARVDRLDFRLSDFTRIAWVSSEARDTWGPRLQRIGEAWSSIAWLSVAKKLRACAIVHVTPARLVQLSPLWTAHGLNAIALQVDCPAPSQLAAGANYVSAPVLRVAVGTTKAVLRLQRCRTRGEHEGIGELLGYPRCCQRFFRRVWVDRRMIDTTWPMATNDSQYGGQDEVEHTGSPYCNILLRCLGVRSVHHLPCSFDCEETEKLGSQFLSFADNMGFQYEASWIRQMLSWPVEWSALHGIAEIKTPVLKVITNTDSTARKHVVRWTGDAYPAEGTTGTRFPYNRTGRPSVEVTSRSRCGAATHCSRDNEWYWLDNHFSSVKYMDAAHAAIVLTAKQVLSGMEGAVVDLGCGNGALVSKICGAGNGLIPYGIDCNPTCVQHARLLNRAFAANFVCADVFSAKAREWLSLGHYELGIVMAGRMLEVNETTRNDFIHLLERTCRKVLVYVYPGYGRNLNEICRAAGLELATTAGNDVGFLSLR